MLHKHFIHSNKLKKKNGFISTYNSFLFLRSRSLMSLFPFFSETENKHKYNGSKCYMCFLLTHRVSVSQADDDVWEDFTFLQHFDIWKPPGKVVKHPSGPDLLLFNLQRINRIHPNHKFDEKGTNCAFLYRENLWFLFTFITLYSQIDIF